MEQQNLNFDGATFDANRDGPRLSRQLRQAMAIMKDGQWRTLTDLAVAVGASHCSVSARLRDMRKARFGGHVVEREHLGGGVYRYRLVLNQWSDPV